MPKLYTEEEALRLATNLPAAAPDQGARLSRIEAMLEFLLAKQIGENRIRATAADMAHLPAGTTHLVVQRSLLDDFNALWANEQAQQGRKGVEDAPED